MLLATMWHQFAWRCQLELDLDGLETGEIYWICDYVLLSYILLSYIFSRWRSLVPPFTPSPSPSPVLSVK